MRKWKYHGKHLPSGKVFAHETRVEYSLTEFLQLLNQWNAASDDWKYWATLGEPIPRTYERG